MFPVGGSGIGRYADTDINLGGYHIPKGTEVAVCLHTLHNVPWNFPDPDTFALERWLAPAAGARARQIWLPDCRILSLRMHLHMRSSSHRLVSVPLTGTQPVTHVPSALHALGKGR